MRFSQTKKGLLAAVVLLTFPALAQAEDVQSLYRGGQYEQVVATLAGKETWGGQEALYIGLSYLRMGKMNEAIRAWQGYSQTHKGSEVRRQIAGYLTLLRQEAARQAAREALRREQELTVAGLEAVAVMPFLNYGNPLHDALSKGLSHLVAVDLARVQSLTVVERFNLQAVTAELSLSATGLVDPSSVARSGKLLGAGRMVMASFSDGEEGGFRVDASLVRTETGETLALPEAIGALATFYDLEKDLVRSILCALLMCLETLDVQTREKVERLHTKNLNALLLYSQGLDALDAREYRRARSLFFMAAEADPEFELARDALIDAPLFPLDLQDRAAESGLFPILFLFGDPTGVLGLAEGGETSVIGPPEPPFPPPPPPPPATRVRVIVPVPK